MAKINYFNVKVPENKDPKNYTFMERRAEILKLIMEAGHPRGINQTKLTERYNKSQPSIANDIKVLADSIRQQSRGEIELISETVYQNSILKLQKEGKYYKAAKVVSMWNEWLFNVGKLEKTPEKMAVETTESLEDEYKRFKKLSDDNSE